MYNRSPSGRFHSEPIEEAARPDPRLVPTATGDF